jgi:hypothetical protein
MAKPSDLAKLRNPLNFPPGEDVKQFDFSGGRVSFDFSGRRIFQVNFSNCVLKGTKFNSCHIKDCTFDGSDWDGCDFQEAIFEANRLGKIKNANKASNLHSVTVPLVGIDQSKFETAVKSWPMWVDWERLSTVGKLPLFGVSTTALVAMPVYFYFLTHYNHSLGVLQKNINSALSDTPASLLEHWPT